MSADAYADYVQSLGPAAYWKLDETSGTNIVDSGPNGLDLTFAGTLTSTSTGIGQFDSAIDFDGTTNYADGVDADRFTFDGVHRGAPFTWIWWSSWDDYNTTAVGAIVGNTVGSNEAGFLVEFGDTTTNDVFRFGTSNGSTTSYTHHAFGTDSITDGTFRFYALTCDGTTVEFFDSASSVGTVALTSKVTALTDFITIGGTEYSATRYFWWDGKLCQVAFFPKVLTGAQLTMLNNLGTNAYTVAGNLKHGGVNVSNNVRAIDVTDGRVVGSATADGSGNFTMDVSTTNDVYLIEYKTPYVAGADERPRVHGPITVT